MSEAASATGDKAKGPAGSNKLLLLIVLVVNVVMAGGLAYVVILGQKNAAAAAAALAKATAASNGEEGDAEAEGGSGEHGGPKKVASKFGPLVDIGAFVANLNPGTGGGHYAKISLHVEAVNEDAKTRLEAARVPIRNEALLFLNGLNSEQAIGPEKMRALQEELLKRFTVLLGKNTVRRVYFAEFVIQ